MAAASVDAVASDALASNVVLVGEAHNDPGAHQFELSLLQRLLASTGGTPAAPRHAAVAPPPLSSLTAPFAACAAGGSTNIWTILHTDPHLITPSPSETPTPPAAADAPQRPASTPPASHGPSFSMLSSVAPCMLTAAACAPSPAGGTNLSSAAANAAAAESMKPLLHNAFMSVSKSFSSLCGLGSGSGDASRPSNELHTRGVATAHTAPASVISDDDSMDAASHVEMLGSPRDSLHAHQAARAALGAAPTPPFLLPGGDDGEAPPPPARGASPHAARANAALNDLAYHSMWMWNARETSAGKHADVVVSGPRGGGAPPRGRGGAAAPRATTPSPLSHHQHTASLGSIHHGQDILAHLPPSSRRPPPHPPAALLPPSSGATASPVEPFPPSAFSLQSCRAALSAACAPRGATAPADAVGTQLSAPLASIAQGPSAAPPRRRVALSLEMFEGDVQRVVDEYLARHISEADFLEVCPR